MSRLVAVSATSCKRCRNYVVADKSNVMCAIEALRHDFHPPALVALTFDEFLEMLRRSLAHRLRMPEATLMHLVGPHYVT
jgi:hypothetical protein